MHTPWSADTARRHLCYCSQECRAWPAALPVASDQPGERGPRVAPVGVSAWGHLKSATERPIRAEMAEIKGENVRSSQGALAVALLRAVVDRCSQPIVPADLFVSRSNLVLVDARWCLFSRECGACEVAEG